MDLIAEIGQAHDGSLGIAHSLIDSLSKTGVNAVKFQMHIAEYESSEFEPFRINFSYEDKTRYDYWKRMEFTFEQWQGLKDHCESCGLEFLASPFSNKAVDILEDLSVKRYKIGSGEVSNFLLLEKIARTNKPVILSSGLTSVEELEDSYNFLKERNIETSILKCTTSYPTSPGEWCLNEIPKFLEKFNTKIGYSDHSGKIHPLIAAKILGASIFEFHVTFDKEMFGPDSKASLTINQVKQLVQSLKEIDHDKNYPIKKNLSNLKIIFGKSLSVNKNLDKNHIISFDDLESKKPAQKGIDTNNFINIIGQKLKTSKIKGDFLNYSDFE